MNRRSFLARLIAVPAALLALPAVTPRPTYKGVPIIFDDEWYARADKLDRMVRSPKWTPKNFSVPITYTGPPFPNRRSQ